MSGMLDKIKGRMKETFGTAVDDDSMRREGKLDQFSGSVKSRTDRMADAARDAASDAGHKMDDLRHRRRRGRDL